MVGAPPRRRGDTGRQQPRTKALPAGLSAQPGGEAEGLEGCCHASVVPPSVVLRKAYAKSPGDAAFDF
jgi:hypothetical protein